MTANLCPPCPMCGQGTACECASRFGPFELYGPAGESIGSFVTIGLAVSCLRVLRKFCPHATSRPVLVTRQGLPVELPSLES